MLLTTASLLVAERAPTARVLCLRAFRNILTRYMGPLQNRENNCKRVAIAWRGDLDGEVDGRLESRREENCREGLVGLGSQHRVGQKLRGNQSTDGENFAQSRLPSSPPGIFKNLSWIELPDTALATTKDMVV